LTKKTPSSGRGLHGKKQKYNPFFFHPDFTVGTGIKPVLLALADFTADREFHPALKICDSIV
jgi:hypothetical protein